MEHLHVLSNQERLAHVLANDNEKLRRLNQQLADERDDALTKLAEAQAEIERLTNVGLEAAYGETMQADELEHWIATCDRLTAERDDLAGKLAAAQAERQAVIDKARSMVARRETELHDLRIKAGLKSEWAERIVCPTCGKQQDATVFREPGQPWAVRVHICVTCEYEIMESEWFVVPWSAEAVAP